MQLFDSHCHLDDRSYDRDRRAVLDRARQAGVSGLMIVGIGASSSQKALQLAIANDGCYCSVGIHPHDAKSCDDHLLKQLVSLADHPKVKAWGETGLDFNRMYSPRSDQEKWFLRQLETAQHLNYPLIFHERDSNGRFMEILHSHAHSSIKGVVHCFSGNRKELHQYLDFGLFIGITGIATLKKRGAELRRMLPSIPADRLLVETDAPFLTPAPEKNRTRRNEPAFVKSVLLKVAAVRQDNPATLAANVWQNTCRLYGIDPGNRN